MPGQHQNWDGGKEVVELVEVSTGDVIDLFCTKDVSVEQSNVSAEAGLDELQAGAAIAKMGHDQASIDLLATFIKNY